MPRFQSFLLRGLGLAYAVSAFVGTWAFFTCFILFLGNIPRRSDPWLAPSVDHGATIEPAWAMLANACLLLVFCLQHSLMARPSFKRWLGTLLPGALERATYVHAANATGFLFMLLWNPIPLPVWEIENVFVKTLLWLGFASGWLLLFSAAFAIDLTELLGLRQAWEWYLGRTPRKLELKTRGLYRIIEHPMYVGVMLGFWMTPNMSVGHALLALQLTIYIGVAMAYERRDLHAKFGRPYEHWRVGLRTGAEEVHAPDPIAAGHPHRVPLAMEPLPVVMIALLAQLAAAEARGSNSAATALRQAH